MSFKSKQRAKHSHLFGDDPLSASSPVTDDPLFGSTTTSPSRLSSRSPTPTDPLRKPGKSNGSIFGDIDVSKLGGGSLLSSTKRSTFRSDSPLDEDALFGGSGHRRQQQKQQQQRQTVRSSSPISTSSSLSDNASNRSAESTDNYQPGSLPSSSPKPAPSVPRQSSPATLPERPAVVPSVARIRPVEAKETPPPVPERPMSRKLQPPPPPPPRLTLPEDQPKHQQQRQQQPPPIPERTQPPVNGKVPQKQEQKQQQLSLFGRFMVNKKKQQQQEQQLQVQDEKQESKTHQRDGPYYDDPELLASVVNDALRFESPSMIPSVSTPQTESNPWSAVDPMKTTSSPLIKTHQDIEPSKRIAFADLIDSWHGKKTATTPPLLQDDDHFFQRIAVEQQDIGFAGIQAEQQIKSMNSNHRSNHHLWDIEETDNPWR
ncbi:hypothetical protein BX666DRAFT_1918507 [Dichotomocladium elegans]|nr:hypothetical protein BX666DRAFT_1918507 [Dichotomocladium elegans]